MVCIFAPLYIIKHQRYKLAVTLEEEVANKLAKKPTFNHKTWYWEATRDPNQFLVKCSKSNGVLFTIAFPGADVAAHTKNLKLVASAPDLRDMVDAFHDSMLGSSAEGSMIFSIVATLMLRLQ